MIIRIAGDKWVAELIVSSKASPDGHWHCLAEVLADSRAEGVSGAQFILDLFAKGREAFIRTAPEADTYTDFETGLARHQGITRFSFKLEAGEWVVPAETPQVIIPSAGPAPFVANAASLGFEATGDEGIQDDLLKWPPRYGWRRHWFADTPGRIALAVSQGWTHVPRPVYGEPLELWTYSGPRLNMYLMEIHESRFAAGADAVAKSGCLAVRQPDGEPR